jgi:hypothetical protein
MVSDGIAGHQSISYRNLITYISFGGFILSLNDVPELRRLLPAIGSRADSIAASERGAMDSGALSVPGHCRDTDFPASTLTRCFNWRPGADDDEHYVYAIAL